VSNVAGKLCRSTRTMAYPVRSGATSGPAFAMLKDADGAHNREHLVLNARREAGGWFVENEKARPGEDSAPLGMTNDNA
jgi:hypothetical protein